MFRMGAEKTLEHLLSGMADAAIRFDDLCQVLDMIKYEIIIYWSDEDETFVAEVPELPGCSAHGPTQEGTLGNAQDAVRLWIDTAKEFGNSVPAPKGRRLILA